VDLQVKKDDRDLCEDDKDLVDELFNPESLRRTEVSHRTLFCFTAQEIRTLNILVMLSKGTTQISEPMPLSATGDDRSALSEDTNKSEVIRTLCKHDRRRNQQDEGSLMRKRAKKRSATQSPAMVTKAMPTREVTGPVFRYGALQAFCCHR
jgi:hypothetical protein